MPNFLKNFAKLAAILALLLLPGSVLTADQISYDDEDFVFLQNQPPSRSADTRNPDNWSWDEFRYYRELWRKLAVDEKFRSQFASNPENLGAVAFMRDTLSRFQNSRLAQTVFSGLNIRSLLNWAEQVQAQALQIAAAPPSQAATQPPAQPRPQPAAQAPVGAQVPITDVEARNTIISSARGYLNARYVWNSVQPAPLPGRFDCSGLIVQAYRDAGIHIPRLNSKTMWSQGREVSRSDVQPGDIMVFGERGTPSHVAIYLDQTYMIHAASGGPRTGVIVDSQNARYWAPRFMGFRTFVGVPMSRSAGMSFAVADFPLQISATPQRSSELLPVLAGTAISFSLTNATGNDGQFDIFFYKQGSGRNVEDMETLAIRNNASRESKIYVVDETGLYRLEVVSKSNNRTLLDYGFNVEE